MLILFVVGQIGCILLPELMPDKKFNDSFAPMNKPYYYLFLFLLHVSFAGSVYGQSMLQRRISVEARRKSVAEVLKMAEKQGGFYFSYSNDMVKSDSLISISVRNRTVASFLETMFGSRYQYIESNDHLIIQPALSFQYWYVSGTVVDKNTGEPVSYATVYERQQLISTMTDERGHFRLQLKERKPVASINVSKVSYADTMIILSSDQPQDIQIGIQQIQYTLDSVVISGVEKNWLAGLMLSSKQTMNSLNLNNFFSKQPFQFSLTPGLGSHGRMGAQMVNKFSFNVFGGYTAGVNGFELGTLFNIVKHDMRYVEIAGLFNIVGGRASGLQIAGLYNSVLDSLSGIQVAGLSNIVARDMKGIQVAGIYNHSLHSKGIQISGIGNIGVKSSKGVMIGGVFNSTRNMDGVQISGIANVNVKRSSGVQVAGLVNVTAREMKGIQISGMVNLAQTLKGTQIGIVNIADTSEGYSIGFFNFILRGYHKLSISSSELMHLTLAYKSGNRKLYSILIAGFQLDEKEKAFAFGYGLGSDLPVGKKGFFFNPELTHQYIYAGNDEQQNLLARLQLNMKYKVGKLCYIYAGPAFSILYSKQVDIPEGYRSDFINGYPSVSFGKEVKGWLGWCIGLDLF